MKIRTSHENILIEADYFCYACDTFWEEGSTTEAIMFGDNSPPYACRLCGQCDRVVAPVRNGHHFRIDCDDPDAGVAGGTKKKEKPQSKIIRQTRGRLLLLWNKAKAALWSSFSFSSDH